MATTVEAENFAKKKANILSFCSNWNFTEKKYLEAVLDGLEMMTAFYSYGNGTIDIFEYDPIWETLDERVIMSKINRAIKFDLGIIISAEKFPTSLWFDTEDEELIDDIEFP